MSVRRRYRYRVAKGACTHFAEESGNLKRAILRYLLINFKSVIFFILTFEFSNNEIKQVFTFTKASTTEL